MLRFVALLIALPALAPPAAYAQSAEADIRAAFAQWAEDFNAKRTDRICDLFASDLQSDYRGVPARGFDRQCSILKRSLNDPDRAYSYALAIREIQVWGDIAMARVTWTLNIRDTGSGKEITVIEPSMDIFRRDSDGKWRIFRYLAYDEG